MANRTVNYGLVKPTQDEFYDIEVQNANFDTVDSLLKSKVDTVEGKGLSTNDFTDAEKGKLAECLTATEVSGIVNQSVQEANTAHKLILQVNGWSSSAPYIQTVQVNGIKDTDVPVGSILVGKGASKELKKSAECIDGFETGNGSITFYCNRKRPSVELTALIKGV